MNEIPEAKKNHLWRKTVWFTDPEQFPLGPHHSAEVYCSEESNGYAVWYVRKLGKEHPAGVDNGDYLLSYHGKDARDEALERAVLLANSAATPEAVLKALDALAASAQRM